MNAPRLKLVGADVSSAPNSDQDTTDVRVNMTTHENYPNIVNEDVPIPERIQFGGDFMNGELDKLLGGDENPGMIVGGSIFMTGEQNAGKTTGTMQMADSLTASGHTVIYNNQEMIESTIKMFTDRLGLKHGFGLRASDSGLSNAENPALAALELITGSITDDGLSPDLALMKDFIETCKKRNEERDAHNAGIAENNADLEREHNRWLVREKQREKHPDLPALPKPQLQKEDHGRVILFIDSIQALAGGRGAALDLLERFVKIAQIMGAVVILIGQVNKDGKASGYNAMGHTVTTHLHLSVVSNTKEDQTRLWETKKNRAGPCNYLYTQLWKTGHSWISNSEVEDDD